MGTEGQAQSKPPSWPSGERPRSTGLQPPCLAGAHRQEGWRDGTVRCTCFPLGSHSAWLIIMCFITVNKNTHSICCVLRALYPGALLRCHRQTVGSSHLLLRFGQAAAPQLLRDAQRRGAQSSKPALDGWNRGIHISPGPGLPTPPPLFPQVQPLRKLWSSLGQPFTMRQPHGRLGLPAL